MGRSRGGRLEKEGEIGSTRPGREYKQQIPPSQLPNPALSRYMTSEVCVSQSFSSLISSPAALNAPPPHPPTPQLPSLLLGFLRCVMTPPPFKKEKVFFLFFAVSPLTPCPFPGLGRRTIICCQSFKLPSASCDEDSSSLWSDPV